MCQPDLFRIPNKPWNAGRIIGPKAPLKPKHIWAIRQQLTSWRVWPRSDAGLHPDRDLCLSMRFRRPRNDELSISLSFFHVEEAMKKLTLAVALLALLGTTAMAQQTSQSQPTGRTGVSGSNATINSGGMTSINSGGMTSFGMRDSTTGMNARSGPERGSPDGSPATAPQATTGPNGQPSNNETLPK